MKTDYFTLVKDVKKIQRDNTLDKIRIRNEKGRGKKTNENNDTLRRKIKFPRENLCAKERLTVPNQLMFYK